jgi:hypothetical protein
MKTKLLSVTLACLVTTCVVNGAPLQETAAVHAKPDASSATITYLKAGSEPVAAQDGLASTPAGWMAVEIPGPLEGYAESKDFTKGLDIKPGTAIHSAPDMKSGVIAVAEKGDKTSITGLHGKWTQVNVDKKIVGYINVGGSAGYVPPIATTPATSTQPLSPAPIAPIAYGVGGPGQPAPTVNLGDSSSTLPRQFAGIFVSTRSVLHPRRPFDWALNDNAGKRYAYVDISKLLLTDQIEKYVSHWVVVFGAPKPTADGKDIVIQVESLQLK